jgi:Bacterial protein of unknown function (DUF945).
VVIVKKRLALVLSSITLVVGCSYFLTGKVIQKNYYESIAKINAQHNNKVSILSYKRGLIHSDVLLEVTVAAENPEAMQIVPLHQVITHGPIIAVNTPKGFGIKVLAGQIKTYFGETLEQLLETSTSKIQPLVIITLVDFSQQATTWVSMTAINQTTANQFHVQWDTIVGEIAHDLNFANYNGKISAPQLIISKPEWEFKIDNLAINLDTKHGSDNYYSSHTVSTQAITFTKNDKAILKLNDVATKLAFINKDNNLTLNLEASVTNSLIVNQEFTQDVIKLQANYLNRDLLEHLPRFGALSPKATIDFMQNLTINSTALTLELPKHFTEALLSYISFEMYRSSQLGRFDKRPEQVVLVDITGSINKLIQGAVKQKILLDNGSYYALNFQQNQPVNSAGG